ncbi:MAG: NAD-dependent epimerase/dehydratase family protein [Thermoguttaceae bacterium]
MATFLVTGGAGFIGSHLVERLLQTGYGVVVIDDLSSGSLENIAPLRTDPHLEFVQADAGDPAVLAEWMPRVDAVFHLAAAVGVFNIIARPVATINNNVGTTTAVLEAAAKRKTRVLLASTSEVYGKSSMPAFHEDGDLVLGPTSKFRWSYAASKIVDEFLALAFWQEYQLPAVVVRLFNTIGPRQTGRYGMVVPRFLGQALRGENLTVFGNGRQTRCFTYVADVVEWLLRLAADDRAVGRVFNLGNPTEISILGLAERVIALTGAKVGVDLVPYAEAYAEGFEDMQRRVPDIHRVTALTGYTPRVDLDEALCRTQHWLISRTSPNP